MEIEEVEAARLGKVADNRASSSSSASSERRVRIFLKLLWYIVGYIIVVEVEVARLSSAELCLDSISEPQSQQD